MVPRLGHQVSALMDKLSESFGGTAVGRICDKDFYHESGDCVVLVGETLFKVGLPFCFSCIKGHCWSDTPLSASKRRVSFW